MNMSYRSIVAIDPSLNGTGLACIRPLPSAMNKTQQKKLRKAENPPPQQIFEAVSGGGGVYTLGLYGTLTVVHPVASQADREYRYTRLQNLEKEIRQFIHLHVRSPVLFVVEDYSYGSKANREVAGEVGWAARRECVNYFNKCTQYGGTIIEMPIPTWKRVIYPSWPGWTKANWEAAKKKGKWRRSQPDKNAIIMQLQREYGLALPNPDEADAVAIAIAALDINKDKVELVYDQ